LFTPDGNIDHSYSERASHDDFDEDEDEDEEHESQEDELPGKITHEGNKVQVMRNEWRERATVEDRCMGQGTDLVYGLTDRRENFEIDTFDCNGYKPLKGKYIAHKWIAIEKSLYISLDIENGGGIIQLGAQIFPMVQHDSKSTSEIERMIVVRFIGDGDSK